MSKRLHVKYPLFLSDFFDRFSKKSQISRFIKIRPVGAELFYADRETDGRTDGHDEANTRFSLSCERG